MTKVLPLVTVVIPIYNVIRYIEEGISLLLSQDYTSLEIILVDDGSFDGSSEVCDKLGRSTANIRVFHQKNQGAGSARNVGIREAKGKYIYFFDIDDKADRELLAYCVENMERYNADFMLFGFNAVDLSLGNRKDTVRYVERYIASNGELRDVFLDNFVFVKYGNGYPWNKFYRRSFLLENHLLFDNQRIQQDEVFNLKMYPHVRRAFISSRVLYTYYIRSKGNTRNHFIPDRFDIFVSVRDRFENLKSYWKIHDRRFEDFLNHRFFVSIDDAIRYNLFHEGCEWSNERRKNEFLRILSHPYTQSALIYRKSLSLNLESRIYLRQYVNASWMGIWLWNTLFRYLRKFKNWL